MRTFWLFLFVSLLAVPSLAQDWWKVDGAGLDPWGLLPGKKKAAELYTPTDEFPEFQDTLTGDAKAGIGAAPVPEHFDLFILQYQQVQATGATPQQVAQMNRRVLRDIDLDRTDRRIDRPESISREQAQNLMDAMNAHPVVGKGAAARYDPDGFMGFCFGRATWSHLELLRRGVRKEPIRKVWAIGSIIGPGASWRYHVATIVRSSEGGWWALDNYLDRLVTLEEWAERMQAMNPDGKLRVYHTEARRLGPYPGKYSKRNLHLQDYRGYFEDMLRRLREDVGEVH